MELMAEQLTNLGEYCFALMCYVKLKYSFKQIQFILNIVYKWQQMINYLLVL